MKKFLLLLVGVLFALSAQAADYYLIGTINNWTQKDANLLFSATSTDGVYELQYTGTIKTTDYFKINNGSWSWVENSSDNVNIGPKSKSASDNTLTTSEAKAYLNANQDNGGFYLKEELTDPYILLDTKTGTLTVYESKLADPGETAEVNGTYVYFQNTNNWSKVAVWAWNGGTNCNSNGTWPGDEITSANTDGGYYFWACKSETTPANLLFNQKDSPDSGKTGNFDFVNGALYNASGKVADPSTQVIYFDANGTGWSSVKMSYRTAVTEEIVGTAVEGKDGVYKFVFATALPTTAWTVTFTDGTNTLSTKSGFTNYNSGYVYKANDSNIEQAATTIDDYTPATSEYKDMEIAISGDFLSTSWAAPGTSDAAPRFTWQEGSTFTLDLSGYTFETSTSFKIFNVTGDLKSTHNNYGEGYGSNGNAVTLGTSYTLARTDATNANLTVSAKVVNPQITLDASNWTITITAKEIETTYDYYIHGKALGDGSWTAYKMTAQADGTWTYTSDKFTPTRRFGIRQTDHNQSSQTAWIYNNGTSGKTTIDDGEGVLVSLGVQYSCVIENSEKNNGKNWGTDANFSTGTSYTLVFDPEAMTIVFINPTAVNATVDAEAVTIGNSKANNLTVNVSVADYYKGTAVESYTLSNGSYSATSSDGNFTNVPYATNYTLTPGTGAAMPINITMPTTSFEISQTHTLVAPAADSETGKAHLVVYFKATCNWLYNLPQIVCTSGSETISGNVVWKSSAAGDGDYDFAFIANDVVAYDSDNKAAAEDKTFYFVVTPVYPFAVEAPAATPAPSKMRAAASGFQYVTGAAVAGQTVEITPSSPVSGVEGVVIEAEDAPVEYFNLQGQRVNGDLAPGIYIRRQGSTVTKVRF